MVVEGEAFRTADICVDAGMQIKVSVNGSWVLRYIIQEDILRKIVPGVVSD